MSRSPYTGYDASSLRFVPVLGSSEVTASRGQCMSLVLLLENNVLLSTGLIGHLVSKVDL